MNRRGLLFGFGVLLAVPPIVRVSSLMTIKPLPRLKVFTVALCVSGVPGGVVTFGGLAWVGMQGLKMGDTFTIEGLYA